MPSLSPARGIRLSSPSCARGRSLLGVWKQPTKMESISNGFSWQDTGVAADWVVTSNHIVHRRLQACCPVRSACVRSLRRRCWRPRWPSRPCSLATLQSQIPYVTVRLLPPVCALLVSRPQNIQW